MMLDISLKLFITLIIKLFITFILYKLIKHDEKYKVVVVKDVLSIVILCIILAFIKGTIDIGVVMISIACIIISAFNIMSLADGIVMGSLCLVVEPVYSLIMFILIGIRILTSKVSVPLMLPIGIGYWIYEIVEIVKGVI